jgi:hypothetical protein
LEVEFLKLEIMSAILELKLSRAHNSEHFQFGVNFLEQFTPSVAASLNLSRQRELCQRLHDMEEEVFVPNRRFRQTAGIRKLDRERDQLFVTLKISINLSLRRGTAAQKAAAKALAFLIYPYRKLYQQSYIENEALLELFIEDAKSDKYAPHFETLGLTAMVEQLKALNDQFGALYNERSQERQIRSERVKTAQVRREMDVAYRAITSVLPALYITETDEARRQMIGDVIHHINSIVRQLRQSIARRAARQASGGAAEGD